MLNTCKLLFIGFIAAMARSLGARTAIADKH